MRKDFLGAGGKNAFFPPARCLDGRGAAKIAKIAKIANFWG